jgi:apolipoprotein N-acyltransferase
VSAVPLALTLEDKWSLGLLGLSLLALILGAVLARFLATRDNRTFRLAFPAVALITLGLFAVFIYVARVHVKG